MRWFNLWQIYLIEKQEFFWFFFSKKRKNKTKPFSAFGGSPVSLGCGDLQSWPWREMARRNFPLKSVPQTWECTWELAGLVLPGAWPLLTHTLTSPSSQPGCHSGAQGPAPTCPWRREDTGSGCRPFPGSSLGRMEPTPPSAGSALWSSVNWCSSLKPYVTGTLTFKPLDLTACFEILCWSPHKWKKNG